MKAKSMKQRKPSQTEIYRDALAGVKYADAQLANLEPGQTVNLFWERSNPVDPNAIRVESVGGVKLGYIKKNCTEQLHWYRTRKIKLTATITAIYPNNPSWESLYVKITAPSVITGGVDEEQL